MNKLESYRLGAEALGYLKDSLATGLDLSRSLTTVDWSRGDFMTCLPPFLGDEEINSFETGGKFRGKSDSRSPREGIGPLVERIPDDADLELARAVAKALDACPDGVALIEDATSRTEDPNLPTDHGLAVLGETLVHVVSGSDAQNAETLAEIIGWTNSIWHFLLAVSEAPPQHAESGHSDGLGRIDNVDLFVRKLKFLAVGAYDGEGYVLWIRR